MCNELFVFEDFNVCNNTDPEKSWSEFINLCVSMSNLWIVEIEHDSTYKPVHTLLPIP